ncbi:lysylphosphatidylglycerol synthase domain-containing protein [Chelatococcus reniformis]|uniref:Membrane protein n=1 Tax=Chelatococcus reniformis TaxID=1494448 RepID=A0A916UD65_9HYPH|nr:lysylphosphatidylglycerol synthase domain-containing protein [Chelatococcus reniformis]GGC68190.1 membrane protein [Chelatococcus reniformis]
MIAGTGAAEGAGHGARSPWSRLKVIVTGRPFRLLAFAGAVLLGLGLLYRTLSRYSIAELSSAVSAVSLGSLVMAGLFAAASYLTLTFFDFFALRAAGKPLPYRQAALASFSSLSLGHNVGFAGLSSGAIRYRFYARWGLNAGEVAQVVLFCGVTVAIGLSTLAGIMLLADPAAAEQLLGFSRGEVVGIATLVLALPLGYVLLAALPERLVRREVWRLHRPPVPLALAQVLVGTVNFACVAACLHQVVRQMADIGYPAVASTYVAANVATLITHVPGGLGVVETVVQHLLPGADLIGPLLVFRIVYFLLPLALGLALLSATEIRHRAMSQG